MKVYLAGPMKGYEDNNHPAFHEAEARWREAGHVVFSPAALDKAIQHAAIGPAELRQCIKLDLVCIEHADAIALLPGWEKSSGATLELAYTQFLGLPVYDALTMGPIRPVSKPWAWVADG